MTRQLPDLDEQDFYRQALGDSADAWTPWLTPRCLEALWRHYQELRRWNRLVSLVGPGTAEEVWHRHYAESLAAVPWLAELLVAVPSESPPTVLDLGSGAGFPGFVVAAALPGLAVTLVETKEKKWAFLEHAARRSGVACRALRCRLAVPLPAAASGAGLPERIDVLTVRALRLPDPLLAALRQRMPAGGRLLRWATGDAADLAAGAPAGFLPGRVLALAGGDRRCLVESVAIGT